MNVEKNILQSVGRSAGCYMLPIAFRRSEVRPEDQLARLMRLEEIVKLPSHVCLILSFR